MRSLLIATCFAAVFLLQTALSENNFQVKVLNSELDDKADAWIGDCDMKLKKLNKTAAVIGGKCCLKQNVPMTALFSILAYERKDANTYKDDASVNITRPLCEYLVNDKATYPKIHDNSDYPDRCPVNSGCYEMTNYVLLSSDLPENIPGDHWLILTCLYKEESTMSELVFCSKMQILLDRSKGKGGKGKGGKDGKGGKGKKG